MSHTLLLQHRTLPGRRAEVEKVWQKHMRPAIARNDGHAAYFYCFGDDPA